MLCKAMYMWYYHVHLLTATHQMRTLMSQLLIDRPFDPGDRPTGVRVPLLLGSVKLVREDVGVLEKVAAVKRAFLCQDDCLCHGDLRVLITS